MDSRSAKPKRRGPTFRYLLLIVVQGVRELILFPALAVWLVSLPVRAVGLADWLTPVGWCIAAPALYLSWLLVYLAICALHMRVLFWGYHKPQRAVLVAGRRETLGHVRRWVCYARSHLVEELPLVRGLALVPCLRALYLLSYAPRVRIGRNVNLWGFLHDPDLTEIGDDVVLGSGCAIAAHVLSRQGPGESIYLSAPVRIGDGATIGGDTRIAMGVTVGAAAIVEGFSNVVALTQIGPGEVWGGNPAVFLRRRGDLHPADTTAASVKGSTDPSRDRLAVTAPVATAAMSNRHPALDDAGPLSRAARLVALALDQPLETVAGGDWDSLQQLAIALTLAETCGYRAPGDDIFEIHSLADVARAMSHRADGGSGVPAQHGSQRQEV